MSRLAATQPPSNDPAPPATTLALLQDPAPTATSPGAAGTAALLDARMLPHLTAEAVHAHPANELPGAGGASERTASQRSSRNGRDIWANTPGAPMRENSDGGEAIWPPGRGPLGLLFDALKEPDPEDFCDYVPRQAAFGGFQSPIPPDICAELKALHQEKISIVQRNNRETLAMLPAFEAAIRLVRRHALFCSMLVHMPQPQTVAQDVSPYNRCALILRVLFRGSEVSLLHLLECPQLASCFAHSTHLQGA